LFSLNAKIVDISTAKREILLNVKDAEKLGVHIHDRVKIRYGEKFTTAIVNTTKTFIQPSEVGIFRDVVQELNVKDGDPISIELLPFPTSVKFIHKKMRGQQLKKDEILHVVQDVVNQNLSEVEIAAFLLAEYYHGMTMEEIASLTKAMVETGARIDFEKPVYDKHSVGGIPGNKVTLLIVPIVAAAGLLIPKTSSRAITSPAGTANTMSVLAPVEFTAEELKEIALKTNGAIVWGGSLNMAPADDIFIRVEYPLQIDPESQMLASIMAKKLAVGADYVVIDLPVGKEAKVETFEEARRLSNQFIELGERLGIKVKCGVTYGGQPVGYTVGPALEAREALQALEGKGPTSLIEKSTALAGLLLEMSGRVAKGEGQNYAKNVLEQGKALKKMREIIEAQGGNPNVKPEDIPVGQYKAEIIAPCDGYIARVSNNAISTIARAAGAPVDKGAGVVFYGKEGHKVKKGQVLLEIYAESESKLDQAYSLALKLMPITIEGMLLYEIPEY
jgi:AMP phosphorylase